MSPRNIGKVIELSNGKRVMVVELTGKDIWRGKHKSLHEAAPLEEAFIGVDTILLKRAEKYAVTHVMVIIEEIRRLYLAPITRFFEQDVSRSRANWQGRSTRLVATANLMQHYLGPDLHKPKRRSSQLAQT